MRIRKLCGLYIIDDYAKIVRFDKSIFHRKICETKT